MDLSLLLHFLRFDIRSRSLDLEPWLRRLYRSNDLTTRFPDRRPRLLLEVERADGPHALDIAPMPDGVFIETLLGFGRCLHAGGRFYSANAGRYAHVIEYDPGAHRIRANLGGCYLDSGQLAVVYFVRPMLHSLIPTFFGLRSLHGAVVTRSGRTVLLAGAGGAGKSTAAVALLRNGYQLLSDDMTFFTLDGGRALALAALDYLHLTRDSLALFPELREAVIGAADHKDKFAVSPDCFGGFSREPHAVTHYVHLERRPVECPTVARLDRRAVLRELLSESMLIARSPALRSADPRFRRASEFLFDLAHALAAGATAFRLTYADHQLSALPGIIDALDAAPPGNGAP